MDDHDISPKDFSKVSMLHLDFKYNLVTRNVVKQSQDFSDDDVDL